MPSTVKDLQREARANLKKKVKIYNPDSDDFSAQYAGKKYTVPALDWASFPKYIADHVKKHLATHLMYKRGVKHNPELDLQEIYKEIEMP